MHARQPLKFTIEPPDKDKHNRAAFACEQDPLNTYIRERARRDVEKKVAAVYVATPDGKTIAGYYTLSQYAIDAGDFPEQMIRELRLPKYKTLPATLLGRLARDGRFKGCGVGELLLMSALSRSLDHSRSVASCAVVVDAKDQRAIDFYMEYGFISLPGPTNRLFLPMRTVDAMFDESQWEKP